MAVVLDNTRVAVTGEVYVGVLATAAPTAADSTLPVGFVGLGAISEDGVTEERERSTDDLRIWQNNAIARTVVTESAFRLSFTMVETNPATVALYYGSAPTADELVIDPAATGGRQSFVLDVIDGDVVERTYIASGEVTEVGEKTYAGGELVGYEVTITAYGNPVRWYSAFGA